jgi:hypothetical protein
MTDENRNPPEAGRTQSSTVIRLDPEQFSAVAGSLPNPHKKIFSLENMTQLANIFALIAAGVWALHEYFSFQRESHSLELDRSKVEIEQRQATARLLELDETVKRAEAGFASEAPLKFDIDTEIDKIGKQGNRNVYWVSLRIGAHNQSKNIVDITAAHVIVFIGTPSSQQQTAPIVRLSGPYRPNSTIDWKPVVNTYYYAASDPKTDAEHIKSGGIIACPAFGRLVYNEQWGECGLDYRVVARPDQFIGMTETFTVARDNDTYPYDFDQWRPLKYVGRQTMSGVPVTNGAK